MRWVLPISIFAELLEDGLSEQEIYCVKARRDSRTEPREHNQPQEEKNTRIIFEIINKERCYRLKVIG